MSPTSPISDPNDDLARTREALADVLPKAAVGIVLGSGLGRDLRQALVGGGSAAYADLPGLRRCGVPGHEGTLHWGRVRGREVVVFAGRSHLYEGASIAEVTASIRLLSWLSARAVVLTTAAGALNPDYRPGDLVLVRDHLNLTGRDPMRELPMARRQPLFPDGRHIYHPALCAGLKRTATDLGLPHHEGVLAAVVGPSYETPAEVRALRILGGDLVCMSTVIEAMAAASSGLAVAAVALVTNAAGDEEDVDHDMVLENAGCFEPRLSGLVGAALERLDDWL